jgi:hypothetical protein
VFYVFVCVAKIRENLNEFPVFRASLSCWSRFQLFTRTSKKQHENIKEQNNSSKACQNFQKAAKKWQQQVTLAA